MHVNWRAFFCASFCVSKEKNLQKLCQTYTLHTLSGKGACPDKKNMGLYTPGVNSYFACLIKRYTDSDAAFLPTQGLTLLPARWQAVSGGKCWRGWVCWICSRDIISEWWPTYLILYGLKLLTPCDWQFLTWVCSGSSVFVHEDFDLRLKQHDDCGPHYTKYDIECLIIY